MLFDNNEETNEIKISQVRWDKSLNHNTVEQ